MFFYIYVYICIVKILKRDIPENHDDNKDSRKYVYVFKSYVTFLLVETAFFVLSGLFAEHDFLYSLLTT